VHKHEGTQRAGAARLHEALNRDPEVVTAYVNRGYMLNDLHQAAGGLRTDFESALKREPTTARRTWDSPMRTSICINRRQRCDRRNWQNEHWAIQGIFT
jgi:hypothetical protein